MTEAVSILLGAMKTFSSLAVSEEGGTETARRHYQLLGAYTARSSNSRFFLHLLICDFFFLVHLYEQRILNSQFIFIMYVFDFIWKKRNLFILHIKGSWKETAGDLS